MSRARPLLVPVLGMHRSGTSIATRALACLGVELGSELLEGGADDNPSGYFEDEALHEISERVLSAVGSSWHDLTPLADGVFEAPEVKALAGDAYVVLRDRLDTNTAYAFKNPRTTRLRAFWVPVFERLDADIRSVCVARHPLSVIHSLGARDDFDPVKSAHLWLAHSLDAALGLGAPPVACIDYDTLFSDAGNVLARVAEALGLGAPDDAPLAEFEASLLDPGLRHTTFDAADLDADPRLGSDVAETWATLQACARGDASLADPATIERLEALRARHAEAGMLLGLAGRQDRSISHLESELSSQLELVAELREELERREGLIEVRDDTVREMDAEIDRQRIHAEGLDSEIVHLKFEAGTQAAAFSEAGNRIENLWSVNEQLRADHAQSDERLHARLQESLARLAELKAEREAAESRTAESEQSFEARLEEARLEHTATRAELERALEDIQHQHVWTHDVKRGAEEAHAEIELERQRAIEWFHAEAARLAGGLVNAAEALSATRAWRTSRRAQHLRDRYRRNRSLDATTHLRNLLLDLESRARRQDMDARTLLDSARLVDETRASIVAGRIFRFIRGVGRLGQGFGPRAEGPTEILERGIGELQAFIEHTLHAPFATSVPALDASDAVLTPASDERIDVVIPVYADHEATLDAIASVRRSQNRTPIEIVVVDDATPEPRLARALDDLAERGEITLLRNEQNLGFPATANRGMALHADRDVVLLNSDTRVHGDWVDRLKRAAHSDWNVATVTPFSNNAEICSYPRVCHSNPYPSVGDQARLDGTLAQVNAGRTLTIPTAVGFCMYLRRDALDQVGAFDALRFERGYGEENDLCMRLRARGLRNVLAADVFVAHAGGASFGAEKQALVERGLQRLAELHPDYLREVETFIAEDPMKPLRVRAEAALLGRSADPTMLFVTHDRGGGTERHVLELAAALTREGVRVLMLAPEPSGSVRVEVYEGDETRNLRFDVETELDDLVDSLQIAGVSHVHFHHLIGLPDAIARLPARLGVTYDVTAHDYFAACPRIHMIDASGVHCPEPEASVCTDCVSRIGSPVGHSVDVEKWRARSEALFAGARRVFVPSTDTATRLARYFAEVNWCVRPHSEAPWDSNSSAAPRRRGQTRVAVVGAIGYHKGSGVLLDCAKDAAARKLPLQFSIIGYSDRTDELIATGHVEISGPYEERDLTRLLDRARCQVAFLPSVWPETYCYSLSEVVRAHLHPIVFDLGAPADRVRAMEFGEVWPLDLTPGEINDRLLATEPTDFPRDRVEAAHHNEWPSVLKDYYEGLSLEAAGEVERT